MERATEAQVTHRRRRDFRLKKKPECIVHPIPSSKSCLTIPDVGNPKGNGCAKGTGCAEHAGQSLCWTGRASMGDTFVCPNGRTPWRERSDRVGPQREGDATEAGRGQRANRWVLRSRPTALGRMCQVQRTGWESCSLMATLAS